MWQNKLNGIFGLWLIALAFIDFSDTLLKVLLVLTGAVIALCSFFGKTLVKPSSELIEIVKRNADAEKAGNQDQNGVKD